MGRQPTPGCELHWKRFVSFRRSAVAAADSLIKVEMCSAAEAGAASRRNGPATFSRAPQRLRSAPATLWSGARVVGSALATIESGRRRFRSAFATVRAVLHGFGSALAASRTAARQLKSGPQRYGTLPHCCRSGPHCCGSGPRAFGSTPQCFFPSPRLE
jgi:hypothetical protein